MKCPSCRGEGIERASYAICSVCTGRGILPDDRLDQPVCAACRGDGLERGSYRVCSVCNGWGRLRFEPSQDEGPRLVFIEAGSPRTAHIDITALFKTLKGPLRIVDPYYGTGSLLRLDALTHCSPIWFLTQTGDRKELSFLSRALSEFRKQHPFVSIRRDETGTLHDRYILSDDDLLLLGHGLKDLGNKDSFLIRIPKTMAGDLLMNVREVFDKKWSQASEIT